MSQSVCKFVTAHKVVRHFIKGIIELNQRYQSRLSIDIFDYFDDFVKFITIT